MRLSFSQIFLSFEYDALRLCRELIMALTVFDSPWQQLAHLSAWGPVMSVENHRFCSSYTVTLRIVQLSSRLSCRAGEQIRARGCNLAVMLDLFDNILKIRRRTHRKKKKRTHRHLHHSSEYLCALPPHVRRINNIPQLAPRCLPILAHTFSLVLK
jgi:hypothetical protein